MTPREDDIFLLLLFVPIGALCICAYVSLFL